MMKILDHLEEWLITLLIGGATLITFTAVVHRYMSGYAIPGLQDWLRRCMGPAKGSGPC